MPWAARVQVAEPYTRESQYWLPTLRYRDDAAHHDLQQWFALSDPAIEDALHDMPVFHKVAKLHNGATRLPVPVLPNAWPS